MATAKFGPFMPYSDDTWPLAEFTISLGIVNGETLSMPLWSSRSSWTSNSHSPPIPEPITTPQRKGSSFSKSIPQSATASLAEPIANWVKRSSRLSSFGGAMSSPSGCQCTWPPN